MTDLVDVANLPTGCKGVGSARQSSKTRGFCFNLRIYFGLSPRGFPQLVCYLFEVFINKSAGWT